MDTPSTAAQSSDDDPDGTQLFTTASTQKINDNSFRWKMYVDKLFYTNTYEMFPTDDTSSMTYNYASMKVRRGSILNLQGISLGKKDNICRIYKSFCLIIGLNIEGNTFFKNIGYSGTAFIVDNFTNTESNVLFAYKASSFDLIFNSLSNYYH